LIAPPPALAAAVNTFYVIETDIVRVDEVLPAYSAQLVLVVRGQVRLTYAGGRTAPLTGVALITPQLRSAACALEGPVLLVGASCTALGWQMITNLPADEVHDRPIPAPEVLTAEQIAALETEMAALAAGRTAPEDLCAALGTVIAQAPFALRDDHVALVEAFTQWLGSGVDPPLADLYGAGAGSPRQMQRIARRFFGVPPAQALKRHRAIRAAMLLAHPAQSETLRLEMMGSYFDQAHLIRDIRRYAGRTLRQLQVPNLARGLLEPHAHGDSAAFLREPAA
jgi:hypothetical protein